MLRKLLKRQKGASTMAKPVVSIILMTHNDGIHLKRSILSVCKQEFDKPFELIVIADSCNDNTSEIVKDIQKDFKFISYFEVEHRSIYKNRIFGVKKAKAELIMFINGDDYVAPNFVSVMYNTMKKGDYDMVNCGFNVITKNGYHRYALLSDASVNRTKALSMLFEDLYMRAYMQTKIFRKDLFLKIEIFPILENNNLGNIRYEDLMFCFYYLLNVKKVKCIKDCLYYSSKSTEYSITAYGYRRGTDDVMVRNAIRIKLNELNDPVLLKAFLKSKSRARTLILADFIMSKFPNAEVKKTIKKSIISDFRNIFNKNYDISKAIYLGLNHASEK